MKNFTLNSNSKKKKDKIPIVKDRNWGPISSENEADDWYSLDNPNPRKRRFLENSVDLTSKLSKTSEAHFPKFIVLTSKNSEKPLTKISPFALQKTIQGCAGSVEKVSKMRSGSVLIECSRKQQADNLLSLKDITGIAITSEPHRSLNSSQGIIRDRDRTLAHLDENELCEELDDQGVIRVKRFTKRVDGNIVKLNTYLLTFKSSTPPKAINVGPYRTKVDTYVPNPTRCFKC